MTTDSEPLWGQPILSTFFLEGSARDQVFHALHGGTHRCAPDSASVWVPPCPY